MPEKIRPYEPLTSERCARTLSPHDDGVRRWARSRRQSGSSPPTSIYKYTL
jgi:hypothetical protein